jgi:hypothetical protein
MNRTPALVLVAVVLLAGCGTVPEATTSAGGAQSAATGAASARPVGSAPLPQVTGPPACRDYEPPRGGVAHDQSDVLAMAERVDALAATVEGFTSLSIDSGHQLVAVYWAGDPPPQLRSLDDADPVVRLVVLPARFSAAQLDVPSERFFATPLRSRGSRHLMVVSVAACEDGSGLRVGITDRRSGKPDRVPAPVAAEIQRMAGDIPVLVVPVSPMLPVGAAGRRQAS